jgi:hypothetical protein
MKHIKTEVIHNIEFTNEELNAVVLALGKCNYDDVKSTAHNREVPIIKDLTSLFNELQKISDLAD